MPAINVRLISLFPAVAPGEQHIRSAGRRDAFQVLFGLKDMPDVWR